MGSIISSIFGGGGGSGGGSDAARQANIFAQKGIDELRRQFDITQENFAPFIGAGTGALPGVIQGTTAGGLDERLAGIFDSDIFGSLVDERTRAVEGQLAAGGLTRSGTAIQEAANIPASLALALEELLSGRITNLAGSGQAAAAGLGGLGAQSSGNIANLFTQQGQNLASGILTDAQARAGGAGTLINAGLTAAGIFFGGGGGGFSDPASRNFGANFSDPALKENVERISHIHDLSLVEWDWIPETKGTMIEKFPTIGFMADEVAEKYPDFVAEYCGFMVIDYPGLLLELEAA